MIKLCDIILTLVDTSQINYCLGKGSNIRLFTTGSSIHLSFPPIWICVEKLDDIKPKDNK